MTNLAAILSAVAAGIAAVLAGLNLYLSGRREQVRWARDALVTTFVDYLTAVYDRRGACWELLEFARGIHAGSPQVPELIRKADMAREQMLQCISRLRVLTSQDAVDAALRLHELSDLHYQLVMRDGQSPREDELREALGSFGADRDQFVRISKQVLSIR